MMRLSIALGAALLVSAAMELESRAQQIDAAATPPDVAGDAATEDVNEFALADYDDNGCVEWEELRNRVMIVFAAIDRNRDGTLHADEHPASAEGEVLPADLSRIVDTASFQSAMRSAFKSADVNANDCIEPDEWE